MLDLLKVIVLFSTSKLRVNVAWYCLQIGCYPLRDIGLILLFNLDIEMWMDVTNWPDILLEGDVVTLSNIVFKSLLVEGDMLHIMSGIVSICLIEDVGTLGVGWPCVSRGTIGC